MVNGGATIHNVFDVATITFFNVCSIELMELMALIDVDGNGELDINEMAIGLKTHLHLDLSQESLDVLFKEFDMDGDGKVDSTEYAHCSQNSRQPYPSLPQCTLLDCFCGSHVCLVPQTSLICVVTARLSGLRLVLRFISKMSTIRGEPDLQKAMKTIVDWMHSKNFETSNIMDLFDKDGDGILSHDELEHGLSENVPALDEDLIDFLIDAFDEDHSG